MSIFLENSSDEQKKVILSEVKNHSPIVVIAGAGSGKTTTIINKMGYIIENNILPSEILALSFSNKSAKEIKDRVTNKLGAIANNITTGTFHSIALRILKTYNNAFKEYKILDEDDNHKYIKKIYDINYGDIIKTIKNDFKLGNISVEEYESKSSILSDISDILWCISRSKNTNENIFSIIFSKIIEKNENIEIIRNNKYISYLDILYSSEEYEKFQDKIVKFAEDNDMDQLHLLNIKYLVKTIKEYEKNKIKDKYQSFDDLLISVVTYLDHNKQIRKIIDEKYKYIFVDEFQDVNFIQFEFLKLINQDYNFLFVVGDADQAIYSFRGCDCFYFNNMSNIYPDTRIFFLNDNYRSDGHIVAIANLSIENNRKRYKKVMNNIKEPVNVPKIISTYSEGELFDNIAKKIENYAKQNNDKYDTAILYRNNMHSYQIQKALISKRIPFKVVGGQNIFTKKYSKDLKSLLHITLSLDPISLERIIMLYPKIGEKKAEKILIDIEKIKYNGGDIFEQIKQIGFIKELQPLYTLLTNIYSNKITHSELLTTFYNDFLVNDINKHVQADKITNEKDITEDVLELIKELYDKGYETMDIIDMISLDNTDTEDTDNNKVILSTIHRSKGLEWDNVFIIKAYNAIFPNFKTQDNLFLLEEERNLFYVAMTRAKTNLFLGVPAVSYNGFEEKPVMPSMFINEISDYLE